MVCSLRWVIDPTATRALLRSAVRQRKGRRSLEKRRNYVAIGAAGFGRCDVGWHGCLWRLVHAVSDVGSVEGMADSCPTGPERAQSREGAIRVTVPLPHGFRLN